MVLSVFQIANSVCKIKYSNQPDLYVTAYLSNYAYIQFHSVFSQDSYQIFKTFWLTAHCAKFVFSRACSYSRVRMIRAQKQSGLERGTTVYFLWNQTARRNKWSRKWFGESTEVPKIKCITMHVETLL